MEQHSAFPENIAELATEYQRLWPLIPVVHTAMGKLAGKEAIRACAKRLGMLGRQGNKSGIFFEHELEMDVFQDYLNYMYRPRGISLAQQLRNRNRFPPGSDEQLLLEAMVQARFSLFWVRALHPGGGFVALDVVTGEEVCVLDQAMAKQGEVGLLLGFRRFPFRNVWMHTGATMVLGQIEDAAGLEPMGRTLSEREERELNESNIRRWRELARERE